MSYVGNEALEIEPPYALSIRVDGERGRRPLRSDNRKFSTGAFSQKSPIFTHHCKLPMGTRG
jgi:hypothetical protein